MTNAELKAKLDNWSDRLVPVSGELMRRACGDRDEHSEKCTCPTCKAFLTCHALINEMEAVMKELT